jgi:tetratricopeptide (TPR) repeat protein
MRMTWMGVALTLLLAQPAAALSPGNETELRTVNDAEDLILQKKPAEAIAMLDPLIATLDKRYDDDSKLQFCASSGSETIFYATLGATAGKDAIVYDSSWCTAIFLKGFALIDLGRRAEARPYLERAVELAPYNAHFLAEMGEFHKMERDWPHSYELFSRAAGAAEMAPEDVRSQRRGRAWRGMGFAKIEMGELDDAEALMRKCLKLNPNDAGARQELDYIAEQRAKAKPTT